MPSESVLTQLRAFVEERDWAQFHSPSSLARSISIEAGELLECFQWSDDFDRDSTIAELADVMTYCLLMADTLGVNVDDIVLAKLQLTKAKYPVDTAAGRSTKYDRLPD